MSAAGQNIYRTKRWKELRLQVLNEEPTCHWCRKAPATEADHLVELARGGEPYERSNLVGSCKPCNSRRGSAFQARRGQPRKVSFQDAVPTPPPHLAVSRMEQSDSAESSSTPIEVASSEPTPPRLKTVSWGDKSFGPQVAAWAQLNMGIDMFPWQIEAINGMLEVDDKWRLRHRFALVSVGRQNGKTKGLLAPLIGWWLTHYAAQRGEPQNVMSTAHKLDVAEDVANVLFPILEEKFGFQTYRSFGRKEAFHEGGSRWRVVSSGESAGHGTSNDLVVVDEIWNVKPEVIEGGLLPTQTARLAPFAFFTSTAGSEDSKFFIRWRERGMQQIEAGEPGRLYMAEWSPPANVDPTERRWWSWANPSLGYTITEQELADKLEALDRGEFVRHHCNMWTSSIGSWLPHGAWEALQVDDPMPAGGILAVDSNATDMRYVGVRVALREDGRYQADTEFAVETQDEMWDEVHRVMADKSVTLLLTPGLATMCPLDLSRRMEMWGYLEINRYTAIVKGMILEGRMAHNGKMTLTEQVNRAVAGRTQASITLTSQKSPGPIEQCRCMVAAAGMAAKPQSNIRKPMIGSSR